MTVSQMVMLISGTGPLLVACGLLGISDGIMWSVGPFLTVKCFGLKNAGKNFGFVVIAAATFVLLFSLGVEPSVFNAHKADGESDCTGPSCFTITHVLIATSGILGTFAALFMKSQV